MRNENNLIKEWIDKSPWVTASIAVAAILGFLLGTGNGIYTLYTAWSDIRGGAQISAVKFKKVTKARVPESVFYLYNSPWDGEPVISSKRMSVTSNKTGDSLTFLLNIEDGFLVVDAWPIRFRVTNTSKRDLHITKCWIDHIINNSSISIQSLAWRHGSLHDADAEKYNLPVASIQSGGFSDVDITFFTPRPDTSLIGPIKTQYLSLYCTDQYGETVKADPVLREFK